MGENCLVTKQCKTTPLHVGLIATCNDKHYANGIALRIQRNVEVCCSFKRYLLFSLIFENKQPLFSRYFFVFFFVFCFDIVQGKMN